MMIRCPECRRKISEQAETCPGCGRMFTPKELAALRRKRDIRTVKFFFGVIAVIVVLAALDAWIPDPPPKPYKPPSPEERLQSNLLRNLRYLVKANMHNPDSYQHVDTYYWKSGNRIYAQHVFRGTNAFNAVVTNWVLVEADTNGNITRILQQGP